MSHLTAAQRRAYVISDNQLAISGAGWDEELLRGELGNLREAGFNLELIGFDGKELSSIFDEPALSDSRSQTSDQKKIECPECGHIFEMEK